MNVYRAVGRYRWWLVGALATLFFLLAGFDLSILPDAIADKCDQPNKTNKDYCAGYIVAGAFVDRVATFLKPYSDVLTALSGIVVAAFTLTLWLTTRQMWRTSLNQMSLTRELFEAERRPWIRFGAEIVQPVEFDSSGLRITLKFTLTNVGQSPAFFVFPEFKIRSRRSDPWQIDWQRQFCEGIKQGSNGPNSAGFTIFRDETKEISITTTMPQLEIVADIQSQAIPAHIAQRFPSSFSPAVIGCIDYQSGDPLVHHQTRFGYEIHDRGTPEHGLSGNLMFFEPGPVPLDRLALVPILVHGHLFFAD